MVYTGFPQCVAGWLAPWVPQYGLHRVFPGCGRLTSTVITTVWFTQDFPSVLLVDQHCEYLSGLHRGFSSVLQVDQHCEYLSMVYTGFPQYVASWPALWVLQYGLYRVSPMCYRLISTVNSSGWFTQGFPYVLQVDKHYEYIIFFQFLEDINSFCGATNTPVLDFWWCLLWVLKPARAALFPLGGGLRVTRSLSTLSWFTQGLVAVVGRNDSYLMDTVHPVWQRDHESPQHEIES